MSERRLYRYCFATNKVVPIEEAVSQADIAAHRYTTDDMPPTKHPLTGEYMTSKSKFRAVTRAHGYEEVGNEYEKGYDPSRSLREKEARVLGQVSDVFRRRVHG